MPRLRNKQLIDKVILRIKKLREQNGVTVAEFYNDTGIHLARIESLKKDISLSTIGRICDYFDLTLHEFFKGI
jgi:transcriptional regulator with XRE-family HTH domain